MHPYDRVMRARAIGRPTVRVFIEEIFDQFFELHGDRLFADDTAIIGGLATLGDMPVTVVGIEKGANTDEKVYRNFGSAHPEGYRKALRLMHQAEKFGRPIICFVDTAGAYCGIGAEERGQGSAIAKNLMEMMWLKVPVISIITGEGGSGGALGLAVGNQVWMLEHAVYSVITPEGAASILYKDAAKAKEASQDLKLTADNLYEFGVVDRIFAEEDEGFASTFQAVGKALSQTLEAYRTQTGASLAQMRYDKFRKMGSVDA